MPESRAPWWMKVVDASIPNVFTTVNLPFVGVTRGRVTSCACLQVVLVCSWCLSARGGCAGQGLEATHLACRLLLRRSSSADEHSTSEARAGFKAAVS
jgi:hypothetical protein